MRWGGCAGIPIPLHTLVRMRARGWYWVREQAHNFLQKSEGSDVKCAEHAHVQRLYIMGVCGCHPVGFALGASSKSVVLDVIH